ncbi:MAG: hypothetical protein PG977_001054 [Bartonella clarridgeiae]|nr:MAG: hypothetical protein PG977_001054 [Bartonella clarridgeiae]
MVMFLSLRIARLLLYNKMMSKRDLYCNTVNSCLGYIL